MTRGVDFGKKTLHTGNECKFSWDSKQQSEEKNYGIADKKSLAITRSFRKR